MPLSQSWFLQQIANTLLKGKKHSCFSHTCYNKILGKKNIQRDVDSVYSTAAPSPGSSGPAPLSLWWGCWITAV